MNIYAYISSMFQAGCSSLAAYLTGNVLLSLLPAFLMSGLISALIPKKVIIRYLGHNSPKWISYPASVLCGFVLSVCSCTIMPLFASIYKKGAGLGPAITFLFVGPAVNLLALVLTSTQIGTEIALARFIFSIFVGITIGLLMTWLFRKDIARITSASKKGQNPYLHEFSQNTPVPAYIWLLLTLLIGVITLGSLETNLLNKHLMTISLPFTWVKDIDIWLDSLLPSNPWLGINGLSMQQCILIVLLILMAIMTWVGLEKRDKNVKTWAYMLLGLISLILATASFSILVVSKGLSISITGKSLMEVVLIIGIWVVVLRGLKVNELHEWLNETCFFIKRIVPLLMVGAYLSGLARFIIPPVLVEDVIGQNTLLANLVGVLFGILFYFPTLVEVPVAQTFLWLGMHRGPLLAYLLSDPGMSLQSIMMTNSVIGNKKTAVYVLLVSIFSVLSGLVSPINRCACHTGMT